MAKRKKRKSAKKKEQTYSIELKGILLVLIMIIGCSPFGILSNLIKGFAGFLVGSWYVVLLVLVGICGLYMIVKREYPEFFSSKFIGFYVMCLGILVLSHTGYVQKIGENSEVFDVITATIDNLMAFINGAEDIDGGGIIGAALVTLFTKLLTLQGTRVICIALILCGFIMFTGVSIYDAINYFKDKMATAKEKRINKRLAKEAEEDDDDEEEEEEDSKVVISSISELANKPVETPEPVKEEKQEEVPINSKGYRLPPISLLTRPKKVNGKENEDAIKTNVKEIEQVLKDFSIEGKIVAANIGPSVTQYELEMKSGTKVSKITGIHRELALELGVKEVRIQAPIPGKKTVGIELPNKVTTPVVVREILDAVPEDKKDNKLLEYQRLMERTNYDIEMLSETGFCRGVENYSRHLALRGPGETPTTLIDFFGDDFLLVVDESHVTLPQVRAMYNGDQARKSVLVDYGFRLPSAKDNRPLKFEEFEKKLDNVIYISATPGDYELEKCHNEVTEQIIRPTGLLDPLIEVKPTKNQIDDLVEQIRKQINKNERTLITTLTIRMAEELTQYLKKIDIKVAYLHNEIKTLERTRIIRDLRLGKYDVVVGINLLREGIDIPEVSLIAIMDADKQGFLRSERSLIQTIGRAARNADGRVIMYADYVSDAMNKAIRETERRRSIQDAYNKEHGIVPKTIVKEIRDIISNNEEVKDEKPQKLSKSEKAKLMINIENEMKEAAKNLDFERAMELRDILFELKSE